jgi:ribosomal protein S18 acetylase RimI-like enzyme
MRGKDDPVRVRPLTPDDVGDFLAFFDHERGPAFADNPEWAKCYCQFYHTPKAVDWNARPGDVNRIAMRERIATGEMEGFLAFDRDGAGAQVVGWLNAQPRNKLPHCFARMRVPPTAIDVPDYRVAQVLCVVIHPQWRRRGVARTLLEAACATLARRGIALIEGYPFNSGDSTDAGDHYHGPLSMYLAAGFTVFADTPDVTIVRKRLDAA